MKSLADLKDFDVAFRIAERVQKNAQKLLEKLKSSRYEGLSDDSQVRCTLDGNQEPVSVEISPEALLDSNLSDLIFQAMKNANQKSVKSMKIEMQELIGNQMGVDFWAALKDR